MFRVFPGVNTPVDSSPAACFHPLMHADLACLLCSIDPASANLIVPVAQASIISAPILLRGHIRRGVAALRARRGSDHAGYDERRDALPSQLEIEDEDDAASG